VSSRLDRFRPGCPVRTNGSSPYRCAPDGVHGTVIDVGHDVVFVDFPVAQRVLPMSPFELESVVER